MIYYDDEEDDRPLSERDYPSPKDVYDSYVEDEREVDLGWLHDQHWSARRILITTLLLLALLGLILAGLIGVIQLILIPNTPPPTLPPIPPMV
ncbi:MAG TPA: hypothetical protein VER79_01660 [Candidatus Limnocylindrales bacterium]|nr:hypothetical protein [Candidatus Limnocylindrales bacterium]